MMELVNVFDYERLAQARVAPAAWDYYASGSDDEVTLRANRAAFARLQLRPRVLRGVDHCDLTTTVLGTSVSMPILIAPTALQGMAHPEGECATARAAGMMGTLMGVSDSASRTLEDVAAAATGPLWYQLYVTDEVTTAERLQRATAAGYRAILLTVDAPRWGRKERALRSDFDLPPGITYANHASLATKRSILPLTWERLAWLRSLTPLPLVLKGILTAEDAELAVQHGVEGIVVSNHGGRQLDGVPAAIEVLPEIVAAVAQRCEVYLDGGIRRGTDVLKALALGARAVLVGRPILWGLAVDGAAGVVGVLTLLRDEFEQAMALVGCADLAEITPALVRGG
jgi:isopentenyl diphosphate isomerase/L-lactate dehydrogenase-like FMN-dependent dehydrogenase